MSRNLLLIPALGLLFILALRLAFVRALRLLFVPALAVSLSACSPASERTAVEPFDEAKARAEITQLKVETWRALYREQDVDGLRDFLADEFVVLSPDGTATTRDEEVAWLAENPWSGSDDFIFTVQDIVFSDGEVAVVYGHGDSTRTTPDGEPCHHRYWSSNTLVRRDDTWKPLFSHVSGITCTAIGAPESETE